MSDDSQTPAHDQVVAHRYVMHYPDHQPRTSDPHYRDFEAYRHKTKAGARCAFAVKTGDDSECDREHPLELHHTHIEFALQNEVDLALLERDYPGVSDPEKVGEWVESAENLEWLCQFHHRGPGGIHTAAAADFEAEHYVKGLISKAA